MPSDFQEKTEWVFARLMYPPANYGRRGYGRFGRDWTQGRSSWTTDYPRSDRHFASAVRRLTRVQARSVEQPVDLDEHDVYDWPWLYGVEVGHWDLTDDQAKTMREYLLRGGFFTFSRGQKIFYQVAPVLKFFPVTRDVRGGFVAITEMRQK